ncbi:MAG: alpha/beta hydrolase [Thermodesulfobacteriota bacterium]
MAAQRFFIQPIAFQSRSATCRGDLYLPAAAERPPVVIMAHGFGAERTFGLPAFAQRFAENGLAVMLFDYRNFGDSDGEPRNLVDAGRHLADWQAALAHVKTLEAVNPDKIGLWGSSFSGGHVIVTAAREKGVSAIVAQVPFVDSISTLGKLGVGFLLRTIPHALREIGRLLTFRRPHYIRIVGTPEEFAVLNTPESYPGYTAMIPADTDWENRCPARILLTFAAYRPIGWAKSVNCPALLMAGEQDSLIDIGAVKKTADAMPHARLIQYPFGHFDIYTGNAFENAVSEQTDFLLQHLS